MPPKRADSEVKNESKDGKKNPAKSDKTPSENVQNEKPTETQDMSLMEEKLNAAMKNAKERDQKIMKLENYIEKLTDKLKALEDHNSHSSEQKKTDDILKEAQREWENKYSADVKKKEAAVNELIQIRKKVEDLEAEAKKQRETKKTTEDLRKQIQYLETENLLLKNNFNVQKLFKDLETTGGNQDQYMLGLVQDNILAYLHLQMEKLENSSITSNEKPTKSQDNSQMQEKLNAEMEKVKERDQKIVKLDNDIKNLEDKLKTSEYQSRHSSEQKKTDDSLKEEQREWEKNYNAEVKKKETAINELNQMRKKVEDLEAEAKKQSAELQQTVQRNKSDISKLNEEITTLTKERESLHKNIKDLEKTLQTSRESKDTGLKERNEKLSTELINVKRKYDELEKENVRLQKKLQELEKEKVRLQKSQGIHDMGSDELASSVADVCAFCASKGKLNPALYNCKACTEFGRYICGCCKENHDLYTQHNAARISTK